MKQVWFASMQIHDDYCVDKPYVSMCEFAEPDESLGPSSDDAPEVKIEIRAAYLAGKVDVAAYGGGDEERRDAISNLASDGEEYGYIIFHNGGTPGDESDGGCAVDADSEWAGWLAASIAAHEVGS